MNYKVTVFFKDLSCLIFNCNEKQLNYLTSTIEKAVNQKHVGVAGVVINIDEVKYIETIEIEDKK